jgi:GntP family gluconate:H+ symporter
MSSAEGSSGCMSCFPSTNLGAAPLASTGTFSECRVKNSLMRSKWLTLLEIDMAKLSQVCSYSAPMVSELAVITFRNGALWPFVVLGISLLFVITAISVLRIHAFLALIAAALLAGILSSRLPEETGTSAVQHCVRAVELTTSEFGRTAGAIGIAIGLACVIAVCLMESGAADKVVRRFLAVFGENQASLALVVSTYVLSIPIFFDTMFLLMLPLAMTLAMRTKKDYLLYVLSICAGGVVTHSLIVPHPGPMAMVDNLKIDVGFSVIAGLVVGVVPVFGGWMVARRLNKSLDLQLRETPGFPWKDLQKSIQRPESELPGFFIAILPVILPIVLIGAASVVKILADPGSSWQIMEFIGNKNIALLIGAALAVVIMARVKNMSLRQIGDLMDPPLQTAGICILITSAGGAFGLMLKDAGVGDAIQGMAKDHQMNLVVLSYAIALVLRIAQGSATVAMLATSSMIFPMIASGHLPYHPIYIFLSIGFGAMGISWMNDSGFWIVSKLTGFSERETLSSWTVLLAAISVIGFVTTLLLSFVLPLTKL